MNRPLRPLSKQAGRVLNLVNRSIAAAESHPLGGHEFLQFNVLGAYVGEQTPWFVTMRP